VQFADPTSENNEQNLCVYISFSRATTFLPQSVLNQFNGLFRRRLSTSRVLVTPIEGLDQDCSMPTPLETFLFLVGTKLALDEYRSLIHLLAQCKLERHFILLYNIVTLKSNTVSSHTHSTFSLRLSGFVVTSTDVV